MSIEHPNILQNKTNSSLVVASYKVSKVSKQVSKTWIYIAYIIWRNL